VSACYAAIVLAGGLSTRMQRFKPLLPLGDATVTDYVIATFLDCGVEVFLVVGHRRKEVAAVIKKRDITIISNPDYEKGMFSSIQAGVRRLPPGCPAFFMLPVDIPLVRPSTIRSLMAAAEKTPEDIIYPVFNGRRGHPPLIPSGLVPAILGWGKEGGLKAVLESRERLAKEVLVADGNILFDIDMPGDYASLLERFRRREIPTDEECDVLLHDMCQVTQERIRHSFKVADVAVAIGRALEISGIKIDMEVVRAAAILHDIAKGRRKHDIAGGEILRGMGFGRVGDIVAVHSDLAGGNTGLPLEVKVVYLADKFVGGEKLVSIEERYYHPDFPPGAQAAVRERRDVALLVKKELESLIGRSLESIIS
jgi:molybdenum cofactor cytidylyltransferase